MARQIQLPLEGDGVETTLEMQACQEGVQWVRRFGAMRAVSIQTFAHGAYTEEAGPYRLVFRIEIKDGRLIHRQVRTYIKRVRVPQFLGPLVLGEMSEGPNERSWRLVVDIVHCWFGSICRYEGVMRLS